MLFFLVDQGDGLLSIFFIAIRSLLAEGVAYWFRAFL